MSRCAALLRACTPASVRLEMVNLQEVQHPNSARIAPHGRNPTAERNRKELSAVSVDAVPPGVSAPRRVGSVQATVFLGS